MSKEQKNEFKGIEQTQINLINELRGFTGTEQYYKSTFGRLNLTDGINHLRLKTNCFWLIDIVESVQHLKKIKNNKEFILWKIEVKDKCFIITARADTDTPILYKQEGDYTDFPLKELEFYQEGDVLLLKTEH